MGGLSQHESVQDGAGRHDRSPELADLGDERDGGRRMARLARAIEEEIIPRLMLAHRTVQACPQPPAASGGKPISEEDVREFAKLVLSHDDTLALACIESMRACGTSVEMIYLGLLAPTARYLGSLWDQDLCDFTDVTAGLGRLQQVLRALSAAFDAPLEPPLEGRRLLLTAAPGEQHTFGLAMVGEFFRRSGWAVDGGPWDSSDRAPACVAGDWYDLVGFSLAAEVHVDALRECIAEVRAASINRDLGIMVGGPLFDGQPDLASRLDADLVARDGRQAPDVADRWLACRGGRRTVPSVVAAPSARPENENDEKGRTGVLRS